MVFDDGRHVATSQPMLRQVSVQRHAGEQFMLHILSGNKVTNFVWFVASSFIQIVTTRKTRPLGPLSVPRIRYLGPYSLSSKGSISSGKICSRMSAANLLAWSDVKPASARN